MNYQVVKDFVSDKEKLKTIGWFAAAAAFVFFAISNFCDGYACTLTEDGERVMCDGYAWMTFQILAGISLVVAGGALFWSERVKSAIVIALAGLFGLFLGEIGKDFCLAVVYVASTIYFWPTKLRLKTLVAVVVLIVLHLYSYDSGSARETSAWIMSPLQLVLGVFFASRNAQVAALLIKIKDKGIVVRDIALKYCREYGAKLLAILSTFLKPFLKLLLKPFGKLPSLYHESGYRVCFIYGCSVFIVGIICFAVLLFWASPGSVGSGAYEVKFDNWDQDLVVSAITQLVGCVLWGCFIFSQMFCAWKLRGHSIVAGSAPLHLAITRVLCLLLAVCIVIGVVYLFVEDPSEKKMTADWTLHLTLTNIPLLVGAARHCTPKTAISLSAIVTVWHLVGASFVIKLIRDNTAKILSMGSSSDITTDAA